MASRALPFLRWPFLLLRRPTLYLRTALLGAFLSVFATVGLASGGILPTPVAAPGAPPALVVEEPPPPRAIASPAQATNTPAPLTPSEDFIREATRLARAKPATGTLPEHTVAAYALLAGWPPELIDEVLDIAWCESRNNPAAVNGYMRGLMQVNTLWFDYSDTDRDHWSDPLVNLRVARSVYLYDIARGNEPWAQWQCKPGGIVVAASAGAAAVAPVNQPGATPTPDATPNAQVADTTVAPPSPTATPAPWDYKPSWPPKYDRAPLTPSATEAVTPGGESVATPTAAP